MKTKPISRKPIIKIGCPCHPGFTLIELLTVIAIIGILAGIMLATLGPVRNQARLAGCRTHLRQIALALLLYTDDRKGNFPPSVDKTTNKIWSAALVAEGYINTPADSSTLTRVPVMLCPGDTINKTSRGRSYAYCVGVMLNGTQNINAQLNKATVGNPSRQFMLTDYHVENITWTGNNGGYNIGPQDLMKKEDKGVSPSHKNGGRNFAFIDGHVEWRTVAQWESPTSGWRLNEIVY
ncbi:type II secretion system protein [Geminisphaera colitermitum]|uniref:type II secretion system protein n=1 Tax=Geminisphaera colitermitum TaxID=1148786 RepID=UPI000158D051|nr:prepilin-type N-terminal cleavage/methylation domain-containing protein [Geminisphaera colitermitum]